jgi:hypothetical protein
MRRILRVLRLGTTVAFTGVVLLYTTLLSMQAYSKRQASHILDRIEALRVDDPQTKFETAVEGCPLQRDREGIRCVLLSGAYRFQTLWIELWKVLPDSWAEAIWEFSNKVGLRYWRLDIYASLQGSNLQKIAASIYVVGRYEALGAEWGIRSELPSRYASRARNADEQRTYLSWYHITSRPSGEGLGIYTTPQSTPKELLARRINRKCMLSFRGCDGLCELLPDAMPVLAERHEDLGGTCVPRSPCESADSANRRSALCNQVFSPVLPPNNR